jgi:hypothetical protein
MPDKTVACEKIPVHLVIEPLLSRAEGAEPWQMASRPLVAARLRIDVLVSPEDDILPHDCDQSIGRKLWLGVARQVDICPDRRGARDARSGPGNAPKPGTRRHKSIPASGMNGRAFIVQW